MPKLPLARFRSQVSMALAASWITYVGASQSGQGSGPAPQATFRAGVDVVQLDVLVLDKNRRAVRGLTSADFTVVENGKPQPIVAFSSVDVPDPFEPTAPWIRDVAPDVVSNEVEAQRLVAIVMDDANMNFDPAVAQLAKEIAKAAIDQLGPTDLAAVVFTFLGRQQNFTSDRAKLMAAVDSLVPHPGSLGCSLRRGQCDIATLTRVGAVLRNAPAGRKTLIFVSGGRCFTFAKGGWCTDDVSEAIIEVQEMFRTLQEANVTVYAFDANGLQTHQATAADRLPRRSFASPTNDTLRMFAEATGGRAWADTNRPWQYVPEVFRENSSYYLLGFQPTNPVNDGRFRKVEVQVNRRDVEVRTRSGYFAPKVEKSVRATSPPPSPVEVAIARGMPSGQIPLQASAAAFAMPGRREGETAVVVRVRERLTDGSAPPSAGSSDRRQAHVMAAAFDTNWKLVASAEHTLESVLKPDEHGVAEYEVVFRLRLRPGRYEVRFAATHGQLAGSVFLDVEVPDFARESLSLSGLVVERTPALPVAPKQPVADLLQITPTTVREFSSSDRANALVRVYQSARQSPQQVRIVSRIVDESNQTVFDQTALLGIDQFIKNRSADYQLNLPLARLMPGEYLLTVEAVKGQKSALRTMRFQLR